MAPPSPCLLLPANVLFLRARLRPVARRFPRMLFPRNGGPFAAEGGPKELWKSWEGSDGAAGSSAA